MQIHSIGTDLGKTIFHLVALEAVGKVLAKKKSTQTQLLIHGARAAVLRIKRDRVSIGAWLDRLDAGRTKTVLWSSWPTS